MYKLQYNPYLENKLMQQKDITFNFQNILVLVMLLFFGFTSLRFGMFGVGEIILLFFCIIQLNSQQTILLSIRNHMFTLFWFYYISIIMIGYSFNTFFKINPQLIHFDLMAYIVILFLCFTFELAFKGSSFSYLYRLIRFIYFGGIFAVGFLYFLYLCGLRNFSVFSLAYGGADIFSPFANDYHQFAYFVAPLPFIGLFIFGKERRRIIKFLSLLCVLLCIKIGLATTSSTLISSWAISAFLFCTLKVLEFFNKLKRSRSIILAFFCLILILFIFNYDGILTLISNFFKGDSNGENRLVIWSNAIKAWWYSPIVGLGPGSFSGTKVFFGYEAHNTFLQILTQGGILGGIAYILLISKLTKSTSVNIYILCAVIALVIYGLGINDLRRTVLWFYYILFYFLNLKDEEEKSEVITENISNKTRLTLKSE